MNKDFVSFELAVKLKEKGFNQPCMHSYTQYTSNFVYDGDPDHPESHKKGEIHIYDFYNTNDDNGRTTYSMPTISQVLKWLREEKKIFVDIRFNRYDQLYKYYAFAMSTDEDMYGGNLINTYEQAALAGVEYCLNNLI